MGQVYNPRNEAWNPVGRRGAEGVESHILAAAEEGGRTRLSLTRIRPGGTFGPHIDDYKHVFCVSEGQGEVMVGKERRKIVPGDVVFTDVGEPHGLWADPDAELVLVTANIYPAEA